MAHGLEKAAIQVMTFNSTKSTPYPGSSARSEDTAKQGFSTAESKTRIAANGTVTNEIGTTMKETDADVNGNVAAVNETAITTNGPVTTSLVATSNGVAMSSGIRRRSIGWFGHVRR
ncbi:MAG: hypothetical protein M1827_005648 [Pycnora praestabilis]|nr:MAG: hypothetical protein M1827_005648 [Pycnora praestabilis]